MQRIRIGSRDIGKGKPCFVIAEAGVNHNGKMSVAKKLVDAAVRAGADAVKFQTFKAKDVVTEETSAAPYQQKNIGRRISQVALLRKYELPLDAFTELKKYCRRRGIIFLTTPHSSSVIDFVNGLVPAFKIGSGEITNHPFLREIAVKKKPVILSTGMSTMKEVKEAIKVIYKTGNRKVVALHCTTNYPCDTCEANINAMRAMQRELDCLVGYSDHTLGISVPIAAAALGAVVIEKHLSLDRKMLGPDHRASLVPREFREMVNGIREVELALGEGKKKPTKSEQKIMKFVRKSIVAAKNVPKGTKIKRSTICVKRPGTGLSPKLLGRIIGKVAKRDIKEGELFRLGDLR